MKVIFDARMISYPYTGLGRFSGELLIELLELARVKGDKYLVLLWNHNLINNKYVNKIEDYKSSGDYEIIFVDCKRDGITQHFK